MVKLLQEPHVVTGVAEDGTSFERSRLGRAVISVGVTIILAILFFWNLPDSELRRIGSGAVAPLANVTGLDQNWAVFAPNPRQIVLDVRAIATFDDGSTYFWEVPDEDEPFFDPFLTYRWKKWMEQVRLDAMGGLWQPAVEWAARHIEEEAGRPPVRVSLMRRWYDITPPGSPEPAPQWNEYVFHEWEVGG